MRKASYFVVAVVLAASGYAGAQIRSGEWSYPVGSHRDPMQPPAELYRSEGRADLRVEVVVTSPAGSRALVRLGEGGAYTAVAAGDRIGDYRIARIRPDGVTAVLSALGAEREIAVPVDTPSRVPQ